MIQAHTREGWAFLPRLNGRFAIALFDRDKRQLALAIDRMGIATMSWAIDGGCITFSTSSSRVAKRGGSIAVRHQAVFDYFFFHMIPAPSSAYAGVTKLVAGHVATFDATGYRTSKWWLPNFHRDGRPDVHSLISRTKRELERAVASRCTGSSTGSFLSGGLDSSTVTGFLCKVAREPAHSFSIGFGVESFNELEYARISSRHFHSVSHEYEVTPDDIIAAVPLLGRAFDEPFGNSSAVPTYACARYARSLGMTRLLAGDGGDEIFGGNERYARQQVFEAFGVIPAPLRDLLRSLVLRTISNTNPIAPLRKVRSYVDQASIPLPERYESWNYVYREGAAGMFTDEFMSSVDTAGPMRNMREVYESTDAFDLLDKMLHYDWKFTLADNDLRKVVTACDVAGIEVEFPMLDSRVVDLSIEVPSNLKMRGLELRSFFKRAMKGFLPDEVLAKQKHGFGLPFGEWLKTHRALGDLVYGNLSDLKNRGIVTVAFLDRLVDVLNRETKT